VVNITAKGELVHSKNRFVKNFLFIHGLTILVSCDVAVMNAFDGLPGLRVTAINAASFIAACCCPLPERIVCSDLRISDE